MQASLFASGEDLALGPLDSGRERRVLGNGAWVDLRRAWVGGADGLFDRLERSVPWKAEHRWMYERVVAVPRLQCFYAEGEPLPDPALDELRRALDVGYGPELGERFATVGLCLYRDQTDGVAWHGDRLGRSSTEDTVVAIVSLGSGRRFLLRPRGGGTALKFELGPGDLFVMGGSCQRTWEHCVPKSARPIGPRISVQFRPRGVR